MRKFLLATNLILLASSLFAQTSQAPAPPATGTVTTADATPPPRYEDNVRPLGGVQNFDLGNRTELFNLLSPTFDFSSSYGTNPGLVTGPQGQTVWGATTNLGGSLQLMRTGTSQQLSMTYRGAAQLNSYDDTLDTQVHFLSLSDSFRAGRWNFVLGNDFSYEPNANGASMPFLFPGLNPGSGSDLRSGLGPDSTIFTPQSERINNTTVGQVSYGLSRFSTLTGNVSYGIAHYADNIFADTNQLTGTGSFNHQFGRNVIGVTYTYSRFMYTNAAEDFDTHAAEFSYGRRVIGRVSMELGAGPTFSVIHVGPVSFVDTSANGRANLRYAGNKVNFSFGYTRAVTSGSGVTPGAITDDISASIQRKLTRTVTANVSAGYNRNSSARNAGATGVGTFDGTYASAGIAHDVGRNMSFSLGYRGVHQTSDTGFAGLSSHSVVVSLQWKVRPIRLQ